MDGQTANNTFGHSCCQHEGRRKKSSCEYSNLSNACSICGLCILHLTVISVLIWQSFSALFIWKYFQMGQQQFCTLTVPEWVDRFCLQTCSSILTCIRDHPILKHIIHHMQKDMWFFLLNAESEVFFHGIVIPFKQYGKFICRRFIYLFCKLPILWNYDAGRSFLLDGLLHFESNGWTGHNNTQYMVIICNDFIINWIASSSRCHTVCGAYVVVVRPHGNFYLHSTCFM